MRDAWRTRLIAVYSLVMGIAGWLLLIGATPWDDLSIRVPLALALVASGVLLQRLTQARNQLEKRASELEALYEAEQHRAQQLAAIEQARQEEAWTATALLQVAEAVGSLTSLDEILETVVRITPILVGVDRCTILLWQDESQEFVFAKGYAHQREAEPIFDGLRFQPGDVPVLDQLRAHGTPVALEEMAEDEGISATLVQEFNLGNLLALPLRSQGEIHGAMLVDYRDSPVGSPLPKSKDQGSPPGANGVPLQRGMDPQGHFTDYRKTILSGIADQAAMAIANARLHESCTQKVGPSACVRKLTSSRSCAMIDRGGQYGKAVFAEAQVPDRDGGAEG